jgi:hypothetical protein
MYLSGGSDDLPCSEFKSVTHWTATPSQIYADIDLIAEISFYTTTLH